MTKKIHLIMPMAGNGNRFIEAGYDIPKPLIMLNNKPFFYWAVRSVQKYVNLYDIIFVVLKTHVEKFNIDKKIKYYFKEAKIIVIPDVVNGATLSAYEAIKEINDDGIIIINDCDHMFLSNKLYEFCNKNSESDLDGALITFNSDSPKFSYVKLNNDGQVEFTVEKEVVSNKAICGAYYFKNRKVYEESINEYINTYKDSELFLSGVYNVMIKNNKKIICFDIDKHVSYGTPEEYEMAKKSKMFEELI